MTWMHRSLHEMLQVICVTLFETTSLEKLVAHLPEDLQEELFGQIPLSGKNFRALVGPAPQSRRRTIRRRMDARSSPE